MDASVPDGADAAEGPRGNRTAAGSINGLIALARPRDLAMLAILMTATSLTEGIGVLALVPVLADLNGASHRPPWLARILHLTGLTPTIGGLLLVTVAIAMARTMLVHREAVIASRMRNEVVDRLRAAVFAGVIRADWRWLAQSRSSDFGNLIITNVNHVGFGLTSVLKLASTVIVGATYVAVTLLLSWQVALITMLAGGGVLVAFAGQRRRALALGETVGGSRADLHGFVQQGLGGVRLVKAFGTEAALIAHLDRMMADIRGQLELYDLLSSRSQRMLQAGGLIVLAAIVYVGVVVLHVSLPTLLPLMFAFARLVPLIGGVQDQWRSWQYVRPALIETQRLLAETGAVREPPAVPGRPPLSLTTALVLDGVSVTYPGRHAPALEAASLTLRANTTTAMRGPSGAGKSTLADIVMGLISPDAGTLAVDGKVLTASERTHWRRSTAYVQQEPFLFHDSVRANLLLDRDGISEGELKGALARAGAGFVLDFPDGLDTIVGDGGVRLSGGERQRVALARALLGRPALVILDEATSALDAENEQAVRDTLAALRGSVTLLSISHRSSMHEDADQVVEVDTGRLRVIRPYE